MFGRQWFGPGSQVALEEDALAFECLVRKREYTRALELAHNRVKTPDSARLQDFWKRQLNRVLQLRIRSRTSSNISVAFSGFWPSFNSNDNEILNFLRHASSLIGVDIITSNLDPDLLVFSCFGNPELNKYQKATRVLYLGENVRPDFSETDYSLTFDQSSYCGRNIYLPLWLLRSSKYAAQSVDYQPYDLTELEKPRPASGRVDSVVYIGNNSTPLRIEAIRELKNYGIKVECYGSHTRPVSDKLKTMQSYLYSLCFENSFAPGYVTEKIVDSFMGGSFPIYWGGAPPDVFNLEKYFVCNPYQSIAYSIRDFLSWKSSRVGTLLPPLLRQGGVSASDRLAVGNFAKILFDLFLKR
jgi:hypothetical protein